MNLLLVGLFDLAYTVAVLALSAAGLALVFGLMRVINLAHGEFIVLGGYATIVALRLGCNIWVAMLVVAPLAVGIYGFLVERLVIQWLYGRTVDTMLATWGLSLATAGALSMIFGTATTGVPNPVGPVEIGNYRVGGYGLFLIGITVVVFAGLYIVLRCTRAGLVVRGAMQSADVAAVLGHSPRRIYMATFVAGSMLSGLAGGVLSPLVGLAPTAGGQFIAKAFITVITGGASVVTGTIVASALLGAVAKVFEVLTAPVVGEIALLLAAVVLLRALPTGISARLPRGTI
jgi:branched-chain amino acid transport system permease protein